MVPTLNMSSKNMHTNQITGNQQDFWHRTLIFTLFYSPENNTVKCMSMSIYYSLWEHMKQTWKIDERSIRTKWICIHVYHI